MYLKGGKESRESRFPDEDFLAGCCTMYCVWFWPEELSFRRVSSAALRSRQECRGKRSCLVVATATHMLT